ncbi:MAG: SH3 domain-containing protein [Spirochaetales bacterium]|nr:SH3 domain-containing protein [Spirochaetales bacterium]
MKKILTTFIMIVFFGSLLYGEQNLRLCINANHQKESPYYAYNCVVFSTDGKILATASSQCNLWDYQSGILLRSIGFGRHISSVFFTRDRKKIILAGDGAAAIKVFDIGTGKLLHLYKNYISMNCHILAVSPDDTYAAADVYEAGGMCKWYTLYLFNIKTGEHIVVGGDSDGPYFFSEDGRYFYFTQNNEFKCMSIAEKKILDKCNANEQNTINRHTKEMGYLKNKIYKYTSQDNKPNDDNTIYEHDAVIRRMKYIPESGQCAFIDQNNTFFVLDIEKNMIVCKIGNIEPAQILFNPHDGNVLVLNKDVINIINIKQNKVFRRIGANTFKPRYINSCAVSADGTYLAYDVGTSEEPSLSIFDLDSLKVEKQFNRSCFPLLFYSREDIYFQKRYRPAKLQIWNGNSNTMLKELNNIRTYAVLPELSLFFTAEYSKDYKQSSISLYSLPEMSSIAKFPLRYEDNVVVPQKIAVSRDGTEFIIAYASSDEGPGGYTCALLHGNVLQGCALEKIFEEHIMFLKDIVFASKKRLAALCYRDYGEAIKAVIIDINTKKTVFSAEECVNVRFSPDESLCAVTNAADYTIKVYETAVWRLKYSLEENESCQTYMVFSPDSRYLLACGSDSKIKIFDMRSGKLSATLYVVDGDDFIIYTPDCYFMCSEGMEQYISVFQGDTLIRDDEILEKLHNPLKIARLFADIAKSFGKNSLYSFRIGRCNETSVRIRKGPDLSSKIIGLLQKDQLIVILGRSTSKMRIDDMEAYWYNIKTVSGVTGWSYGYFIDSLENSENQ